MSNQLVITNLNQVPAVNLPESVMAKVQAQFNSATEALSSTGSAARLSFAGRSFHLNLGQNKTELDERVLDVYLVAIDPKFHYVFYDKPYTGNENEEIKTLTRYPNAEDPIVFEKTKEWASRAYKQRAIVMLANDPDHKLYIADFGYNSVKKSGNPQLGLFNLAQLVSYLTSINQQNPQILPFMITVQMSFTSASVPEIQFSLIDQRQKGGNQQVRFADNASIEAMINAISSGETDSLLKMDYQTPDAPKSPSAIEEMEDEEDTEETEDADDEYDSDDDEEIIAL